jgi:hypothetical protein
MKITQEFCTHGDKIQTFNSVCFVSTAILNNRKNKKLN